MENKSVFEYKVTKINDRYSAITITHQDEKVFVRGMFTDLELNIFSRSNPALGISGYFIKGYCKHLDSTPIVAENCVIKSIVKSFEALKEKYNRKNKLDDFIKRNIAIRKFRKFEKNCYLEYFGDGRWGYEISFFKPKKNRVCIDYEKAENLVKVLNDDKVTLYDFDLAITKLGFSYMGLISR